MTRTQAFGRRTTARVLACASLAACGATATLVLRVWWSMFSSSDLVYDVPQQRAVEVFRYLIMLGFSALASLLLGVLARWTTRRVADDDRVADLALRWSVAMLMPVLINMLLLPTLL